MEAGEYGLTRGTCFVARRLEVVAVAGHLWGFWRVMGVAGIRFFRLFAFERTRSVASMRPPCLIYLSTSTAVDDCTELRYSSVFTSTCSARAGKYRGSGCTTYNAHSILG